MSKHNLYKQETIKFDKPYNERNYYELRSLLANLRKTIELCFFTDNTQQNIQTNENYKQFILACIEILQHGLTIKREESNQDLWCNTQDYSCSIITNQAQLNKFIEDFEWLYYNTQLHHGKEVQIQTISSFSKFKHESTIATIHTFFHYWLLENINSKCLCACLQALITDKELKDLYYNDGAFLQSECYTTALCICISAMELNQYNLLSQVDAELYHFAGAPPTIVNHLKHKHTGSHPNLSFSAININNYQEKKKESTCLTAQPEVFTKSKISKFCAIPRTKSLPKMRIEQDRTGVETITQSRPRCKTIGTQFVRNYAKRKTKPKSIPSIQTNYSTNAKKLCSNASSSYSQDELDMRPSTSASSKYLCSSQATSPITTTSSETNSISSSIHSTTTTPTNIEIINCENIKIWTDQSLEESNFVKSTNTKADILPPAAIFLKPNKSVSPINSFFANLFGTPPTYTSWSPKQTFECSNDDTLDETITAYPCNKEIFNGGSPISSSVFDAFMPTYGKKVRSRKSQNLFEDGISTLDYTSPTNCNTNDTNVKITEKELHNKINIKNSQSLSDYLKMSQRSHNSTDLEKENAHFRISEAIITAIEHIKWAKMEPDKRPKHDASITTTATDWLEKDHISNDIGCSKNAQKESAEFNEFSEHLPYAEMDCFDELSAEIIGLTLIKKFNDKQLPKVSELKWLVSDEDTPQKLLPMPDDSPTANPDEHVTPSMTRGTRYWAPPRQQIIFTDHQTPNRKELIKKQNYRCVGCGMRISPQNVHSFRYCTYFGKYHCTGCHRNQMSTTPAKILQNWDFKCYPVSVFAYRLLEQMFTFPLFYVPDLNAVLYLQAEALLDARQKRRRLSYVKDFIRFCRFATKEQQYFQQIPNYITDDPDIWSLSDFIDVHNKSMKLSIEDLVLKCEIHIHNCVLCTARGFYCEHCRKNQVLYPWENNVFRCDRCGSCYHKNCWHSMEEICHKCQRLNKRQVQEIL